MQKSRSALDHDLTQNREDILRMGRMVESLIHWSLNSEGVVSIGQVTEGAQRGTTIRERIEKRSLQMLATQHPAARDLRCVIAAMHIARELERSVHHCSGIARLNAHDEEVRRYAILQHMREHAMTMTHSSMDAYVRGDAKLALETAARDEVLDESRTLLMRTMLTTDSQPAAPVLLRAIWTAHNLERIGDRVVNICERVVFEATGHLSDASLPASRRWMENTTA